MGIDDRLGDTEAQAGALTRCFPYLPVALKNVSRLLLRHARASVLHGNGDSISLDAVAQGYRPAGGRELEGIAQQIGQHLLHARGVDLDILGGQS